MTSGFSPTFDSRLFAPMEKIEDQHFWFVSRKRVLFSIIKKITQGFTAGSRILEVGCGTGSNLKVLQQACPHAQVFGFDLMDEGLEIARRQTSCHLIQGNITHPPFGQHFDLVGLFDVLEHLDDDLTVLKNMDRILKPGGYLLLMIPANQSLWSYHDIAHRHRRRYSLDGLSSNLSAAGFEVEYLTYFMASIFPLIFFRRKVFISDRAQISHQSAIDRKIFRDLQVVPVVNSILKLILRAEQTLIDRRWRLPFGTSLLALARKKGRLS